MAFGGNGQLSLAVGDAKLTAVEPAPGAAVAVTSDGQLIVGDGFKIVAEAVYELFVVTGSGDVAVTVAVFTRGEPPDAPHDNAATMFAVRAVPEKIPE
jgi:hypothetical protein